MAVIATYDSHDQADSWAKLLNGLFGREIFEAKDNVIVTIDREVDYDQT